MTLGFLMACVPPCTLALHVEMPEKCPAGTFSASGNRCPAKMVQVKNYGSWKWTDGSYHGWCLGNVANDKTMMEGQTHCGGRESDVALPKDINEDAVLFAYLFDKNTWLGSRRNENQLSVWTNNNFASGYSKGTPPWASGEPNSNNEKCLQKRSSPGRWNDENCDRKLQVICQIAGGCNRCRTDNCPIPGQRREACRVLWVPNAMRNA